MVKWSAEATRAFEKYSAGEPQGERMSCTGNALLLYFLIEVKGTLQAGQDREARVYESNKIVHSVIKAIGSLRDCSCRVSDAAKLRSLDGVGPVMVRMVESALWAAYPPDGADAKEQEEWGQRLNAGSRDKAQTTAAAKKRMAKSKTQHVENAVLLNGTTAPAAAEPAAAASPSRKQKAKAYIPRKGTANYAFLVTMFRGHKMGKSHFLKDELMKLADTSGLAERPIFGSNAHTGGAFNAQQTYNGWSCLTTMVNRDPPLVAKWSNPVKVRLTPEGDVLAGRLFARAVELGDVASLPNVDTQAILAEESSAAAAEATAAPGPAKKRAAASKNKRSHAAAASQGPASTDASDTALTDLNDSSAQAVPAKRAKLTKSNQQHAADAYEPPAFLAPFLPDSAQAAPPDSTDARPPQLAAQPRTGTSAPTARAPAHRVSENDGVIELMDSDDDDLSFGGADEACLPVAAPPAGPSVHRKEQFGCLPQSQVTSSDQDTSLSALPSQQVSLPSTAPQRPAHATAATSCDGNRPGVTAQPPNVASQPSSSRSGQRSQGEWRLPLLRPASITGVELGHIRGPPLPPSRGGVSWQFDDIYDIVTVLDHREQFARSVGARHVDRVEALQIHADRMQAQGVAVDTRSLPIGDLLWVARCKKHEPGGPDVGEEFVLDWVLERKRADDLVGSIMDGRYNRQKYDMMQCGLRFPIYLVEGNLDQLASGSKAAKTAAFETEVMAGFQVLRTASVGETIQLYIRIAKHITAIYKRLPAGNPPVPGFGPLTSYTQWYKEVLRQRRVTVQDAWACMLCSIPGIGVETAEAVLKAYPVPALLLRALSERQKEAALLGKDPEAECVKLLATLPLSLSRKVGNSAAKAVFRLYGPG